MKNKPTTIAVVEQGKIISMPIGDYALKIYAQWDKDGRSPPEGYDSWLDKWKEKWGEK